MTFKQAFKLMLEGEKVKLPSWGGYWCWNTEKETIEMHCQPHDSDKGQGDVLDIRETQRVVYTIENCFSNEWIIATEDNTPVLGGVVMMPYQVAIKYANRGIAVERLADSGSRYIRKEDGRLHEYFPKRGTKQIYDYNINDVKAEDWVFSSKEV